MARSEVFENYIKIALEKGIIKNAEEKKPLKINETNPRFDSKTVKDIENLYGVKPETPEDMKYEKNIIEDAHPERIVLFRSHDRVNSLIENENERQNIILNMMKKMPNGNLTQKRYAQSELTKALIRLANDLDNQNKDELRVLADTCSEQLVKKAGWLEDIGDYLSGKSQSAVDIGEGAATGYAAGRIVLPLVGGIVGGLLGGPGGAMAGYKLMSTVGGTSGAFLGGLSSALFATGPVAKNVAINAETSRQSLANIIKDFPNDEALLTLDNALLHIENTASQYAKMVDKIHMPNHTSADMQAGATFASSYMDELVNLNKLIDIFMADANSGKYAPKESDWYSKLKIPFATLFGGDDVHSTISSLKVLKILINQAEQSINAIKSEITSAASSSTASSSTQAPKASNKSNSAPDTQEFTDYLAETQKQLQNGKNP